MKFFITTMSASTSNVSKLLRTTFPVCTNKLTDFGPLFDCKLENLWSFMKFVI